MLRLPVFVTALFVLAGCAQEPPEMTPERMRLTGVTEQARCSTPKPFPGPFTVLRLDAPLSHGLYENARQVELILDEDVYDDYLKTLGRTAVTTCMMVESTLCGDPQLACEVLAMSPAD